MEPDSIEARDAQSVIHGLTNLKRHLELGPTVIESGHGVWVLDNHGREYIEAMSGLWCIALGYGDKRLAAVAAKQMEQLAKISADRVVDACNRVLYRNGR